MSVPTIVIIDDDDDISLGPGVLNNNFANIRSSFEDLDTLISTTQNTVKLTNLASLPVNSLEAAMAILTATSGNAWTVQPNGGAALAFADVAGNITANKYTAAGNGDAEKSIFNTLQILEDATLDAVTNLNGLVNFVGASSRVASKSDTVVLADTNFGAGAASPLDISLMGLIFFDFNAVTLSTGLNIDVSGIIAGQEFLMVCLRDASGANSIYNGTSSNELFAYIDPAGSGFTTLSDASLPLFAPSTTPNNISYMKVKWMDIGGANMRFVILEYANMTNVG